MFIGDKITHGSLLYWDFVDNKVPGIFYLNALVFFIFGKSIIVPRIMLFLFNGMSALIIYFIGRNLWNENVGRMSCIFFLIGIYVPSIQGSNVLTEQYMVFFGSLGFLMFLKSHHNWKYLFLAGFLLGIAILFKQPGILFYFSIFMYYLLNLRAEENRNSIYIYQSIKSLFLIGCGLIIPILIAALYFYKVGVLHDFIYWSFIFFIEGNYENRIQLFKLITPFEALTIVWVLALFSVVILVYKYIINKYNSNNLFVVVWLLAFGYTLTIRQYPNYLIQILPPVSLLASCAFEKLLPLFYLSNIRKAISKKEIMNSLVVICILGLMIFNICKIVALDNEQMESKLLINQIDISNFIILYTTPGEKILSFPFEPFIYFMSGRDPPVKYPFFVHYPADLIESFGVIDELKKSQIRYIIVNTKIADAGNKYIYKFIQKSYFKLDQAGRWAIYEKSSTADSLG
jgi:4-amino-4-deoxy-L-arabinose transferase-like glycosyltransferase